MVMRCLSLKATATRLGVSPATVRRWIDAGYLPAIQAGPGCAVLVVEAQLDAAVERWAKDAA